MELSTLLHTSVTHENGESAEKQRPSQRITMKEDQHIKHLCHSLCFYDRYGYIQQTPTPLLLWNGGGLFYYSLCFSAVVLI